MLTCLRSFDKQHFLKYQSCLIQVKLFTCFFDTPWLMFSVDTTSPADKYFFPEIEPSAFKYEALRLPASHTLWVSRRRLNQKHRKEMMIPVIMCCVFFIGMKDHPRHFVSLNLFRQWGSEVKVGWCFHSTVPYKDKSIYIYEIKYCGYETWNVIVMLYHSLI